MNEGRKSLSRYVWPMGGLLLAGALFFGLRRGSEAPPARGTVTIEEGPTFTTAARKPQGPVRKIAPVASKPRPQKPAPRPAPKPPAEPSVVVNDTSLRKTYSADGVTIASPTGMLVFGLKDIEIGGRPLPPGRLAQ